MSRAVPQATGPSHLFDGRTALVVGGSGGIGRAIACSLAAGGARLRLHGRDPARVAHALRGYPGQDIAQAADGRALRHGPVGPQAPYPVESVVCDLGTDAVQGANAAQRLDECVEVMLKGGVPDILVVGYGPFLESPLFETTPRQWRELFEANVMLPVTLGQRCLPVMLQRGFGRVVVFGGTGTDRIAGFRTVAAYSAVKTALMSWVKSAAREVGTAGADCGVAVGAICPGYVETEYLSEQMRERYARRIPGGRLSTPEDVANAALALLDPSSALMNGVILSLDGGVRG